MARQRNQVPSYRLHQKTGKAIITVYDDGGNRRSVLLPGPYDSKESRAEYKRYLARLKANEGTLPNRAEERKPSLLVAELALKFMQERVIPYYIDKTTQKPTGEQENFRCALRPLTRMYADLPADEFGPLCLVAVRNAMIDGSWLNDEEKEAYAKAGRASTLSRSTINNRIRRIKLMFSWAVGMQLVPPAIHHGLLAVKGLAAGRSAARETEETTAVPLAIVEETLPHLPPVVSAVVELLLLTGARVGEIVRMRGIDLDMTGNVWLYRPHKHKTLWRGHKRIISIGPKAQAIIREHLKTKADAYLFSPAEQEEMIAAEKRALRKSKIQPSQISRRKANAKRKPGEMFSPGDINQAIKRACKRADIPVWHTHQMRHTAALEIGRKFGLEAARHVLGHKQLSMTVEYAGHDQQAAAEVMAKIG